jgi:hypothetical protein
MFGGRFISTVATVAAVTGLLSAGEIRAQGTLGFTIDPTQGVPGTVVTGQVDVADITASCVTDLTEFQARFNEVALNILAFSAPDPLYLRFFPPDVQDIITTIQTHDQLAYTLTLLVTLGIAINQNGATDIAFPQTFVMTFVDPSTLDPIGELGHFDPATGVGSVVVPDLPPGSWPIAATCVGPTFDRDALEAGIRESGAFLAGIGAPPVSPLDPAFETFAQGFLGSTSTGFDLLIEFATVVGPTLIQNIVVPDALGLQFFTVLATPSEALGDVIDDVRDLVSAGDLKKGQGKGLISILRNAVRSIERGDTDAACGQLGAFQNAASAEGGTAAADVIAQVEQIRGQLGCEQPASPSAAFVDGDVMH